MKSNLPIWDSFFIYPVKCQHRNSKSRLLAELGILCLHLLPAFTTCIPQTRNSSATNQNFTSQLCHFQWLPDTDYWKLALVNLLFFLVWEVKLIKSLFHGILWNQVYFSVSMTFLSCLLYSSQSYVWFFLKYME